MNKLAVFTKVAREISLACAQKLSNPEGAKVALGHIHAQGLLVRPRGIADLVTYVRWDATRGLVNEDVQSNAGAFW